MTGLKILLISTLVILAGSATSKNAILYGESTKNFVPVSILSEEITVQICADINENYKRVSIQEDCSFFAECVLTSHSTILYRCKYPLQFNEQLQICDIPKNNKCRNMKPSSSYRHVRSIDTLNPPSPNIKLVTRTAKLVPKPSTKPPQDTTTTVTAQTKPPGPTPNPPSTNTKPPAPTPKPPSVASTKPPQDITTTVSAQTKPPGPTPNPPSTNTKPPAPTPKPPSVASTKPPQDITTTVSAQTKPPEPSSSPSTPSTKPPGPYPPPFTVLPSTDLDGTTEVNFPTFKTTIPTTKGPLHTVQTTVSENVITSDPGTTVLASNTRSTTTILTIPTYPPAILTSTTSHSTTSQYSLWDEVCKDATADRWHLPHPTDPTKFYKCEINTHTAYLFECDKGLIFYPDIQVCNWP